MLTPSHLIFGRRLTSMPDEITNQVSDDEIGEVNRRFRYLARMRKHFWRRWRKEYLTNLREFHKVRKGKESSDAKVGDLVLGRDKVVRGAKVKVVSKGRTPFINRPVQKLYPLEVDTRVSIQKEIVEEISEKCESVDKGKEEITKNDKVSIEGSSRRPRRAAAQVARWRTQVLFDPKGSKGGVCRINPCKY